MTVLRVGSLVLPLIGGIIWGVLTYYGEQRRAYDSAQQSVALVRQYAERLIQTQTVMHRGAAAYAAGSADPDFIKGRTFHRMLSRIERAQNFTHGLAVIAFDGTMIASSRAFPPTGGFGHRDYLDSIAAGQPLVLDRLILEPDGQDALIVAQPFNHRGFRGAIVSAVEVDAIRNFLQDLAGGRDEAASLLREDGLLLVYANFGVPVTAVRQMWLARAAPVLLLLAAVGLFSFVVAGMAQRTVRQRLDHQEQTRLREAAEMRAAQQQRFMRELNHRVKNNLTMIDSLIAIQLGKSGQLDAAELRQRIAAIADVHDVLYRAANAHRLDLADLLAKICRSPALIPAERGIDVDLDIQAGITLGANRAAPLALALVELLTNAVKHAFPDGPGRITLSLRRQGGLAVLRLRDDGIGMPAAASSLSGIRIVEALIRQIDGSLTREDGPGTRYAISLPITAEDAARDPNA